MWDGVKNLGSRRTTSSFTKSHAMRVNGTKEKKAQTLPRFGVQT